MKKLMVMGMEGIWRLRSCMIKKKEMKRGVEEGGGEGVL